MAIEIERKFLVIGDKLPVLHDATLIQQAYIPTTNNTTVRIRLAGQQALLTIKTRAVNLTRREYEFSIPVVDRKFHSNDKTGTVEDIPPALIGYGDVVGLESVVVPITIGRKDIGQIVIWAVVVADHLGEFAFITGPVDGRYFVTPFEGGQILV